MIIIAQWIHVVAGVLWMGGHVAMIVGVWPLLLEMSPADGKRAYERVSRGIGPVMAVTGFLTLVIGALRGTVFGTIQSFDMLTTPYGITWLFALVATIGISIHGARDSKTIADRLWKDGALQTDVAKRLKRNNVILAHGFAIVITCMILMRFGL